ncbi:hypothetical protein LguiA_024960 [Lonicera macranthoides]
MSSSEYNYSTSLISPPASLDFLNDSLFAIFKHELFSPTSSPTISHFSPPPNSPIVSSRGALFSSFFFPTAQYISNGPIRPDKNPFESRVRKANYVDSSTKASFGLQKGNQFHYLSHGGNRIYESSRWKTPSRRHSSNATHQRNSPSWCGMRVIFREASTIVSIRVPKKSPVDVVGVEEGEVDAGDIMKLC